MRYDTKAYATVDEVAEATGLGASTIRGYYRRGLIKAVKLGISGHKIVIPREEIVRINTTSVNAFEPGD